MFGSTSLLATVIPMIFVFSLLAFLMQLGTKRKPGEDEASAGQAAGRTASHGKAHPV